MKKSKKTQKKPKTIADLALTGKASQKLAFLNNNLKKLVRLVNNEKIQEIIPKNSMGYIETNYRLKQNGLI